MTALHYASQGGYLEIVQILDLAGAELNAKDNEGATPLHLADQGEYSSIVSHLIDASVRRKRDADRRRDGQMGGSKKNKKRTKKSKRSKRSKKSKRSRKSKRK